MCKLIVSALIALCTAAIVQAQAIPAGGRFTTPAAEVSAGFQHVDANAPPGICNCFGINGFYVSGDVTMFKPWFQIAAEFGRGHGDDISNLHQNLTLMTYMAGPKLSLRRSRFNPFLQVLVGGAHGSDSYFPTGNTFTTSADSFALAPGGGLDINLTSHFSVRAIEASYLRTQFPNGTTNTQNQLVLEAGAVFRWGNWNPRSKPTTAPAPVSLPPPPPQTFNFVCSASGNSFKPGDAVKISATASREGNSISTFYSWHASGGQVSGNGDSITIDTTGLLDGTYTITGTASLSTDRSVTQQCDVTFRVNTSVPPPPPAAVAPLPPPTFDQRMKSFRDNVKDIYFDLNKSDLRSDQIPVLDKDAVFLAENPDMHIQIGGFADQRGSSAYNLALGERRANAVRDRLIAHGVSANRIQIVTFGREAEACTANIEECWKQNRRVGFVLQP